MFPMVSNVGFVEVHCYDVDLLRAGVTVLKENRLSAWVIVIGKRLVR